MKNLETFIFESREMLEIDYSVEFGKAKRRKAAPKAKTNTDVKIKQASGKSKIKESELDLIFETLKREYTDLTMFKVRDIKKYAPAWGISEGQVQHRIKRLVELGVLEDCGGSPKSYKLK